MKVNPFGPSNNSACLARIEPCQSESLVKGLASLGQAFSIMSLQNVFFIL
jgi:hypothetical protein